MRFSPEKSRIPKMSSVAVFLVYLQTLLFEAFTVNSAQGTRNFFWTIWAQIRRFYFFKLPKKVF